MFFPKGFEGDSNASNGIQLFAKSVRVDSKGKEKWSNLYGYWVNAAGQAGDWMKIKLDVSDKKGDYLDPGFDPKKVRFIGIKFALGGKVPSEVKFSGDILVDCVSW